MARSTKWVACLLLGASFVAQAAGRFDFDSTPGRLPKDAVPTHYRLQFDVDPARDSFDGRAEIEIDVRRPVEAIVLNAQRLALHSAHLAGATGAVQMLAAENDATRMLWRLSLAKPAAGALAPGRYRLVLHYQGEVQRAAQSLYRVDYVAQGAPARMLATQLSPIHARALFPSFDEPAFRATFDIEATVPARYTVVSNMPLAAETTLADGRKSYRFQRTPSMPTYLVALAVGEFDVLESRFEDVPLRIYTARGKREEARYALEVTHRVLGYFRDYFGVPYALPKLDQLAIPGVRNGAMEDWGAISYNENVLLHDPRRSRPSQQPLIFNIVAHEIAHQWFGNLVTNAWWDDTWLNEAFATWMALKASDDLNPGWRVRVRDRLYRESALERDATDATRAMAEPPAHESSIFEVFDDITYEKGGTVLGMFERHLGAGVFRDGLRRYLAAHRFSNATAADLWFHLGQAAGRDVTALIGSWTDQPGFPLLNVKTRCERGATSVEIAQERFTAQSLKQIAAMWQVPVVLSAGKESQQILLGRAPQQVSFKGCKAVVANGGDTGYYRVQYNAEAMARLRAEFAKLPAVERSGLVADTFALARAGRIGFVDYFTLLDRLRAGPAKTQSMEMEGAIWEQVVEGLTFLDQAFHGTPTQARLRAHARSVLAPVLARLGWQPRPQDDVATLRLRNRLIDALGAFDDRATIERARTLLDGGRGENRLPPSIREGVIRTAARHADDAMFEWLRRRLRETSSQEDDYLYGGALMRVRDAKHVQRVLDLTLTDEWRPTSAAYYAGHIGETSGRPELARAFVREHFEPLAAKASDWSRAWLLPGAYAGFSDEAAADELLGEQEQRLGAAGRDATGPAAQVAAKIRERAAVRARESERLDAWLRNKREQVTRR